MMIDSGAEADSLEEVDGLCKYFDGTADLIAQETGDAGETVSPSTGDGAGRR